MLIISFKFINHTSTIVLSLSFYYPVIHLYDTFVQRIPYAIYCVKCNSVCYTFLVICARKLTRRAQCHLLHLTVVRVEANP